MYKIFQEIVSLASFNITKYCMQKVHYFNNEENFSKGIEWYESKFKNCNPDLRYSLVFRDVGELQIHEVRTQFRKNIKACFHSNFFGVYHCCFLQ